LSTQESESDRSGWILFAVIIMFAVGFARVISGISYLDDSNDVNNLTNALFGDQLWVWGIWDLIIAALAFFAGWSLLSGGGFGYVVAYIWGVVVIVQGFIGFVVAPWYSAAAITLGALVVYGLSKTDRTTMA